jgi:hypothetical protein
VRPLRWTGRGTRVAQGRLRRTGRTGRTGETGRLRGPGRLGRRSGRTRRRPSRRAARPLRLARRRHPETWGDPGMAGRVKATGSLSWSGPPVGSKRTPSLRWYRRSFMGRRLGQSPTRPPTAAPQMTAGRRRSRSQVSLGRRLTPKRRRRGRRRRSLTSGGSWVTKGLGWTRTGRRTAVPQSTGPRPHPTWTRSGSVLQLHPSAIQDERGLRPPHPGTGSAPNRSPLASVGNARSRRAPSRVRRLPRPGQSRTLRPPPGIRKPSARNLRPPPIPRPRPSGLRPASLPRPRPGGPRALRKTGRAPPAGPRSLPNIVRARPWAPRLLPRGLTPPHDDPRLLPSIPRPRRGGHRLPTRGLRTGRRPSGSSGPPHLRTRRSRGPRPQPRARRALWTVR